MATLGAIEAPERGFARPRCLLNITCGHGCNGFCAIIQPVRCGHHAKDGFWGNAMGRQRWGFGWFAERPDQYPNTALANQMISQIRGANAAIPVSAKTQMFG